MTPLCSFQGRVSPLGVAPAGAAGRSLVIDIQRSMEWTADEPAEFATEVKGRRAMSRLRIRGLLTASRSYAFRPRCLQDNRVETAPTDQLPPTTLSFYGFITRIDDLARRNKTTPSCGSSTANARSCRRAVVESALVRMAVRGGADARSGRFVVDVGWHWLGQLVRSGDVVLDAKWGHRAAWRKTPPGVAILRPGAIVSGVPVCCRGNQARFSSGKEKFP